MVTGCGVRLGPGDPPGGLGTFCYRLGTLQCPWDPHHGLVTTAIAWGHTPEPGDAWYGLGTSCCHLSFITMAWGHQYALRSPTMAWGHQDAMRSPTMAWGPMQWTGDPTMTWGLLPWPGDLHMIWGPRHGLGTWSLGTPPWLGDPLA